MAFDFTVTDLTYDTLLADVQAKAAELFPEWDFSNENDVGRFIMEYLLRVCERHTWLINAFGQEFSLATCRERNSAIAHGKLIGYQLTSAQPATCTVQLTFESSGVSRTIDPYTLKLSTKGGSSPVYFENQNSITIDPLITTLTATFVQGETIVESFISSGKSYISYYPKRKKSIDGSFVVKVDGVEWTEVSSFIDSLSTDTHFVIEATEEDGAAVIFGNGVNGKIPPLGAIIEVTYRIGGGYDGNIEIDELTVIDTAPSYVLDASNTTQGVGGEPKESLAHAKLYAPASIVLEVLGNLNDVITYAEDYPGVARATAYSLGNIVNVAIVPDGGGTPSGALKSSLETAIAERLVAGFSVTVSDPSYVAQEIDIEAWAKPGYDMDEVEAAILQVITDELDPLATNGDGLYKNYFGKTFYRHRLQTALAGLASVEGNFVLSTPAADVSLSYDQIITNTGTITILVHGRNVVYTNPKHHID